MKVSFRIDMDVEPGDNFDPINMRYTIAEAINKFMLEGILTDDEDTSIGSIVVTYEG